MSKGTLLEKKVPGFRTQMNTDWNADCYHVTVASHIASICLFKNVLLFVLKSNTSKVLTKEGSQNYNQVYASSTMEANNFLL